MLFGQTTNEGANQNIAAASDAILKPRENSSRSDEGHNFMQLPQRNVCSESAIVKMQNVELTGAARLFRAASLGAQC